MIIIRVHPVGNSPARHSSYGRPGHSGKCHAVCPVTVKIIHGGEKKQNDGEDHSNFANFNDTSNLSPLKEHHGSNEGITCTIVNWKRRNSKVVGRFLTPPCRETRNLKPNTFHIHPCSGRNASHKLKKIITSFWCLDLFPKPLERSNKGRRNVLRGYVFIRESGDGIQSDTASISIG